MELDIVDMEQTCSTGLAKESNSDGENCIDIDLKRYRYSKGFSLREWMRWNGVYFYAYGCSLGGIICALLSPISDMYQGDNKFPYVSEVIRSGTAKSIFVIGCSIGLIPTLFFATNYFITSFHYNRLNSKVFQRYVYNVVNLIIYLCFIYSAFSVIGVSFCDMDFYPELHTLFSFSWVIITNIMGILQYCVVKSNLYVNEQSDNKLMRWKVFYLFLSMCGMINFAVLGSYVPCHSFHMSMETCLSEYPEAFCFSSQLDTPDTTNVIAYRYYGHCPVLHYIRGLGEFFAVVSTMFYLTTIVYDSKKMRAILVERAGGNNGIAIFECDSSSLVYSTNNHNH